jgi:hypothetical protein
MKSFKQFFSESVNEEVEQIDEETMPGNVALRLVDRHQAAAFHHKKNGNMKGYAAHFKVANAIEDSVIRAGRDMPIKSKRLEAASDKAFKEHPHRVVKNEEVELDEARKSTSYQFTHKPGDPESEKRLADLKASVKGTGKRVVLQGRLGKNNPNAHKYSKDAPRAKYVDGKRVNSDVSGKSGAHSHQRIQKADAAHHDVYVYNRNESVEIEETSNLRITKVYNKFPKKATYAVHTPDRKYYKEFDSEDAAKKHLETKK